MTRRYAVTVLAVCALAGAAAAADANMSGHWVLNVKESRWGQKKRAPQNVTLDIQDNGSQFKYSGEITQDLEGQAQRFSCDDCTTDGKEHVVTEGTGQRKITMKRSGNGVQSTLVSMDGKSTETTTTTISHDGKRLTRRITLKAPEGTATWVEIYDKQS